MKVLYFAGPCSCIVFMAHVGPAIVLAVKSLRVFHDGKVLCVVDLGSDEDLARTLLEAVRVAHEIEPIQVDHDVAIAPEVRDFILPRL